MSDTIADLPRDDRPRERMFTHGASTLSEAELVAILLGTGTKGRNAVELARDLMRGEGLRGLHAYEPRHLAKKRGIGVAKACRILAAFELARRSVDCGLDPAEREEMRDLRPLRKSLVARYGHQRQERLGMLLLDSRKRLIAEREIFVGTIGTALVSTRDLIIPIVETPATSIILFHNHPSGDTTPSYEDVVFTQRVADCCKLFDIELTEHFVVGTKRCVGIIERGHVTVTSPSRGAPPRCDPGTAMPQPA
jgi:DNA repair protein RadC